MANNTYEEIGDRPTYRSSADVELTSFEETADCNIKTKKHLLPADDNDKTKLARNNEHSSGNGHVENLPKSANMNKRVFAFIFIPFFISLLISFAALAFTTIIYMEMNST